MISVIIVNYNGYDVIQDCLQALERQTFKEFEIVIVDNGSTDNSLDYLNRYKSNSSSVRPIKLATLSQNLGFSGGNIEGLRHAEGEFIALLNNDTEPHERWLEELVKEIGSISDIGICASMLIEHGSEVVDSAGDGFSAALKGFKRGEGRNKVHFNTQELVFGACAGAALYKREMLNEIGFLDDDFFLIYEDTDLNFRAQLAGWKVLYVPTAVVYHKVRSTIGVMSDTATYYSIRNSELVKFKSVPAIILLRCLPELIISTITEFFYFAVKHKKTGLYFKAKIDAFKMFPQMLRKRKEVMKTRKVSDKYLLSIMTPVWQGDFFRAKLRKIFS